MGLVGFLLLLFVLVYGVTVALYIRSLLSGSPQAWSDYPTFYGVGKDVLAGLNPYAPENFRRHPFISPPTCLPLFLTFSLLPYPAGLSLWAAVSVVLSLALVPLAWKVLRLQGRDENWDLPPVAVAGLASALLCSHSVHAGICDGQVSLYTAALLLLALLAQARMRPIAAGVALSLATVKAGTFLPFLLLFLRKSDFRTWITLAIAIPALCLAQSTPFQLPDQLTQEIKQIRLFGELGKVNDYSLANPYTADLLGFDSMYYWLGFGDRGLIRLAEKLTIFLLGCVVALGVLRRNALPRGAQCSLVGLYAMLFLYHRAYDLVLLALPLTYAVGAALGTSGSAARGWFRSMAIALLLSLYRYGRITLIVLRLTEGWTVIGPIVRLLLVPMGVWLLLLAMTFLYLGVRANRRAPSPGGGL